MKHRPTDLELRLACAEVLGHKVFYQDYDDGKEFPYYIPSGKPKRTHMIDAMPLPDYPNDRNALPELWKAVKSVSRKINEELECAHLLYIEELGDFVGVSPTESYADVWELITAPPRLHVVACLRALGVYDLDEWDEDTEEETQT